MLANIYIGIARPTHRQVLLRVSRTASHAASTSLCFAPSSGTHVRKAVEERSSGPIAGRNQSDLACSCVLWRLTRCLDPWSRLLQILAGKGSEKGAAGPPGQDAGTGESCRDRTLKGAVPLRTPVMTQGTRAVSCYTVIPPETLCRERVWVMRRAAASSAFGAKAMKQERVARNSIQQAGPSVSCII